MQEILLVCSRQMAGQTAGRAVRWPRTEIPFLLTSLSSSSSWGRRIHLRWRPAYPFRTQPSAIRSAFLPGSPKSCRCFPPDLGAPAIFQKHPPLLQLLDRGNNEMGGEANECLERDENINHPINYPIDLFCFRDLTHLQLRHVPSYGVMYS